MQTFLDLDYAATFIVATSFILSNEGKTISETIVSLLTGCGILIVVTATPVSTIDTSPLKFADCKSASSGVVP